MYKYRFTLVFITDILAFASPPHRTIIIYLLSWALFALYTHHILLLFGTHYTILYAYKCIAYIEYTRVSCIFYIYIQIRVYIILYIDSFCAGWHSFYTTHVTRRSLTVGNCDEESFYARCYSITLLMIILAYSLSRATQTYVYSAIMIHYDAFSLSKHTTTYIYFHVYSHVYVYNIYINSYTNPAMSNRCCR